MLRENHGPGVHHPGGRGVPGGVDLRDGADAERAGALDDAGRDRRCRFWARKTIRRAEAEGEAVKSARPPLVAVSDDGEELPVIFPAREGESPEAVEAEEAAGTEEAGLPAPLSAEDVAAAAAALEGLPAGEAAEPAGEQPCRRRLVQKTRRRLRSYRRPLRR